MERVLALLPPSAVGAEVSRAACLAHPDERVAALDHLDFAIKEFEAMKMTPSLESALKATR